MGDPPAAPGNEAGSDGPPRPRSLLELFLAFNRLALQGFGGVLPIAHRELVERLHWLNPDEFVELLALGQVLPGPNIINMAVILGERWFGWRGSVAASAGLLALPSVIVLFLATLYQEFSSQPLVNGALRGMGVAAAGLVISTALKLWKTLARNPLGRIWGSVLAAAMVLLVGLLRWPMLWVLLGLGPLATALAWWVLRRRSAERVAAVIAAAPAPSTVAAGATVAVAVAVEAVEEDSPEGSRTGPGHSAPQDFP
ncbi:MAG: chromate transporter [Treponema sp.]|nr:chromate transporter [Treponema sp.]